MKIRRILIFVAYFMPIIGLGIWVGTLVQKKMGAFVVEIPIMGYDPRDLLAGHYVRFSLDMANLNPCSAKKTKNECVCLATANKVSRPHWIGDCDNRPSDCQQFIRGSCKSGLLHTGLEQFYIPEEDSQWLQTLPAQSTLLVSITPQGHAMPLELKPAGKPYKKWLEEQRLNTKQ